LREVECEDSSEEEQDGQNRRDSFGSEAEVSFFKVFDPIGEFL
jgi:hypothetical protein